MKRRHQANEITPRPVTFGACGAFSSFFPRPVEFQAVLIEKSAIQAPGVASISSFVCSEVVVKFFNDLRLGCKSNVC